MVASGADHQTSGWPARLCVVFIYAVVVAGVTLPSPLYVAYQERWGLSTAAITALYALYPVGILPVLLLAGHWADYIGRRKVILIGLSASSLSALALMLANSLWLLATGRFLTGIASGFVVSAATAVLIEVFPVERRRFASVLSTVTNQLGVGLGALASGFLVQYAWQPSRLVFALHLIALIAAALCLPFVPETVRQTRRLSLELRPLHVPSDHRQEFLSASLAAFSAFALCGLLAALSPSITRDQLGSQSELLAGFAIFIVFGASAVSQVFWVRLNDVPVALTGLGLLVLSLTVMTWGLHRGSTVLFILAVTTGGAAVGAIFMSSLAIVSRISSDAKRGGTISTYFAITFAGLALPVVGTGVAADRLTQFHATALFAFTISLLASLAGVLVVAGRRP